MIQQAIVTKFKNDEIYHILALFRYDMENVAYAIGCEKRTIFQILHQASNLSGYENFEENWEFLISEPMRYAGVKGLDDAMNNRAVNPPARTGEYLYEYLFQYFRYDSELPF